MVLPFNATGSGLVSGCAWQRVHLSLNPRGQGDANDAKTGPHRRSILPVEPRFDTTRAPPNLGGVTSH